MHVKLNSEQQDTIWNKYCYKYLFVIVQIQSCPIIVYENSVLSRGMRHKNCSVFMICFQFLR